MEYKYFSAKLKYLEAVPDSEKMKKVQKNFLVNALSVTEVEIKVQNWIPSNFKEASIKEVKRMPISALKLEGDSEEFWLVKSKTENLDGGKPQIFQEVYNGLNPEEVIKKIKNSLSIFEIESISRFNTIIDKELVED